jgi:hypothetical protein
VTQAVPNLNRPETHERHYVVLVEQVAQPPVHGLQRRSNGTVPG